jgi:hypothetical protein
LCGGESGDRRERELDGAAPSSCDRFQKIEHRSAEVVVPFQQPLQGRSWLNRRVGNFRVPRPALLGILGFFLDGVTLICSLSPPVPATLG